jgi:hypothetical protein
MWRVVIGVFFLYLILKQLLHVALTYHVSVECDLSVLEGPEMKRL